MALRIKDNEFKCIFCGKVFKNAILADSHRESEHNYVLVPMTIEEINRLVNFIYFKNDTLIDNNVLSRLKQYMRHKKEPLKPEDIEDLNETR